MNEINSSEGGVDVCTCIYTWVCMGMYIHTYICLHILFSFHVPYHSATFFFKISSLGDPSMLGHVDLYSF